MCLNYIDLDTGLTLCYLNKCWFTHDNGEMRSVEPEPTANGFSFIVNENSLVWQGEEYHTGISFFCDLQVNAR